MLQEIYHLYGLSVRLLIFLLAVFPLGPPNRWKKRIVDKVSVLYGLHFLEGLDLVDLEGPQREEKVL
jgi:hypothetical protein